jgi:hypothetical protein
MKPIFSLWFDGENQCTIGARRVKIGMEVRHRHIYKLYVKHCS